MTNKVSLDKSKIKFVLLEGVHQSALDTLHAAGYTNIDFYKKESCRGFTPTTLSLLFSSQSVCLPHVDILEITQYYMVFLDYQNILIYIRYR